MSQTKSQMYRIIWYKSLGIGECEDSNGNIRFFTALMIKPLGHMPKIGDLVVFI